MLIDLSARQRSVDCECRDYAVYAVLFIYYFGFVLILIVQINGANHNQQ